MAEAGATIFVAIAAYCDPLLPRTLDDCLARARHPQNLRFGICWQYDPARPMDLERFKADARFRISEHDYRESGGGSWARAIAQTFWDGEPFTLQVDSHTAFAHAWDASLLRMIRALPSDKPLITGIPPLFRIASGGHVRKDIASGVRATRLAKWKRGGGWAPWFDWGVRSEDTFARNRFLAGCFVFTSGVWTDEVRQDPNHYYWGEEFALTLRSFTHGYDLFLPEEFVVWHMDFSPRQPRRHWEHGDDVVNEKRTIASERLRRLAYSSGANQESLGRYGLGTRRGLSEYERYAGLDLHNKRAHPDVYVGRPPNPVTIRNDADWAACLTPEAYKASRA